MTVLSVSSILAVPAGFGWAGCTLNAVSLIVRNPAPSMHTTDTHSPTAPVPTPLCRAVVQPVSRSLLSPAWGTGTSDGTGPSRTQPWVGAAIRQTAGRRSRWSVIAGPQRWGSLWWLGLTLLLPARSQAPLADDFNPGASGAVTALAVQAGGEIVVGGNFTNLAGQARSRLARLRSDGALDEGFGPNVGGTVTSLVIQPDGRILVGGYFTNIAGQVRNRVARLSPDGVLEAGFNPNANASVQCLALQTNGQILVGGYFSQMRGQPRTRFARLHPNGSLDTTFNVVIGRAGSTVPMEVRSIAVQPDGKIVIAGTFDSLGGEPHAYIGRLNSDGTVDGSFTPQADQQVYAVALQPDGRILLAGRFRSVSGHPATFLGRLHPDGTPDRAFNPGPDLTVNGMAVQADGGIVFGGRFTLVAGQSRPYLARVFSDGTLDPAFNPAADRDVYGFAIQADGRIVVGGGFTTIGGQARARLARLMETGGTRQILSYDGNTVSWWRAGGGPEVGRVTFDLNTNGVDWSDLGHGVRVPGGWQLSNVTVPPAATLRARGTVFGAQYSASGWWIEGKVLNGTVLTPPVRTIEGLPRMVLAGLPGRLAVEASSDLVAWVHLATVFNVEGSVEFTDAQPTRGPRFYRSRSVP